MAENKKQWYEENPELLAVEKAAMEIIAKDDDKEFGFLKDERAYWEIGFTSGLSGRKFNVLLVYPTDHPCRIDIPGIRVYPIEPSFKIMIEENNKASGRNDRYIPHSMRDCNGHYYLSVYIPEWCHRTNTLDSSQGIVSAAAVLHETKRFMEFYEKGIAIHGFGFY